MMKHSKLILVGLLLTFFAFAAEDRPCKDDIAKFCKDVKPGGDSLGICIAEHANQLSAACRAASQENKPNPSVDQELRAACKKDIESFCKASEADGTRLIKCLESQLGQATESCKSEIKKLQRRS